MEINDYFFIGRNNGDYVEILFVGGNAGLIQHIGVAKRTSGGWQWHALMFSDLEPHRELFGPVDVVPDDDRCAADYPAFVGCWPVLTPSYWKQDLP